MKGFETLASAALLAALAAPGLAPAAQRPFQELERTVVIELGKAADWVEITPGAVWVGVKKPNSVAKIDPQTNRLVTTTALPGDACGGITSGFGSLWIPLCAEKPGLAQIELASGKLTRVLPIGPPGKEGGITTGAGSVWLIVDKQGSLARIDPASGSIRQTIKVAPGSYNPLFADGRIWITRADGAELTCVDATTGQVLGSTPTGPGPRFLTAGAGSVWTLNQGDGTLTRVDTRTRQPVATIPLRTPGPGGDIKFSAGAVWTTMIEVPLSMIDTASNKLVCQWVGSGGDSLGVGGGAIWLTDLHAGAVERLELKRATSRCRST